LAILDDLNSALKEAMKSRDEVRVSTIRMMKASLKNKEIEKMGDLTGEDVLQVLSTLAKQRRESIEQFSGAGRMELAEKESKELEIIKSYLPKQLSPEELDELIRSAISESGAKSPNDMGKLMKVLMPKVKGAADGKVVNQRVRELLGS
jgi:uncharacterized protein YqeY